jgi:hypothetical protein
MARNPSPASNSGRTKMENGEQVRSHKFTGSVMGNRPYVSTKVPQDQKNPQNRH